MTSTPTRPVDNVVIATKGLQDRNINIIACTTVENKGELIHSLYLSPNIVRVIKSRRLRWADHVARMEKGRSGVPLKF